MEKKVQPQVSISEEVYIPVIDDYKIIRIGQDDPDPIRNVIGTRNIGPSKPKKAPLQDTNKGVTRK